MNPELSGNPDAPWPSVQIRHCARFTYGDSLAAEDRADGQVPVFGSNGQVGVHNEANTRGPAIVIGRKGSYGKVRFSEAPVFAIDTTYSIDCSTTRHDLRWLYYALLTAGLDTLGQDVGVPGLNRETAYARKIPLPPLVEQRAIAEYLDAETARIDALIAKKQQLIHLLEERWLAFLSSQFVTSPDTETRRVAAYADIVLGRQRSPEHASGPFMKKYLRAANVKAGYLALDDVMEMNFTPKETERFVLRPGDVLVTEGSGSRKAVGASAVWNDEIDGPICFQNTLLRMRPRPGVEASFLGWWAEFAHATGLFAEIAGGANIFHVSSERIKAVPMRKVSIVEQSSISVRLDEFRSKSRAIEAVLAQQIELLAERRQALITAAVTGEFTVPGAA